MQLRKFQKDFLAAAFAPGIDTAALSVPRGNGKSFLAAVMGQAVINPGNRAFINGREAVLVAASREQAKIVLNYVREMLHGRDGYKWRDSQNSMGVRHIPTGAGLRVLSSSGKRAMGLVNVPLVIADEPGAWETIGGELMHDALQTAQGKPNSRLRVVYVGTLAPARHGWWHDLITRGSQRSTHVTMLQADPDKWDRWPEIRRCNPLTAVSPSFRAKLLEERDEARLDTRLKARFMSYRLNIPTADEAEMLLTGDDWKRVCAREVAPREGQPLVGIDLGAHRAWSAATAMWQNGRMEAIACAPGIPSLAEQERRDLVPKGSYRKLADAGLLRLAEGLRVVPPGMLTEWIADTWGVPVAVICDRFRLDELRDCAMPCDLVTRMTRWSESAYDIRALRKAAKDGPMSCPEDARPLVLASLTAAYVKNDEQGSFRLEKRGSNNTARDDVAAALTLAAGAYQRMSEGESFGRVKASGGLI